MMRVYDATGDWLVPEVWAEHNWERPYSYLRTLESESRTAGCSQYQHDYLFDKINSGFDCKRALNRRSLTKHADRGITNGDARILTRSLYSALVQEPDLFAALVTVGVGDWPDAYWLVDHSPRSLMHSGRPFDRSQVARLIQGQVWAEGPGLIVVLGIHAEAAEAVAPTEANLRYARALVACGRVGHALLLEGLHLGLAARMTPAVHESTADAMFGLASHQEALYFLRLAHPYGDTR